VVDYFFLLILLPIAGLAIFHVETGKLRLPTNKEVIAISFSILLLVIPPSFSIQPAYADNTIKNIIKIQEIYPADTAFFDYTFLPQVSDINKTMVYMSFSHTGDTDNTDTFRSWKLIDNQTLRLQGEDTASGNIALEFMATIIEYEGDMNIQHLERITGSGESEGEKSNTIPTALNLTNSMITYHGKHQNFSETTVGDEEYTRIRIIDSTNWGWLVGNTPNQSPTIDLVDVVDWNQNDIFAQRGLVTMTGTTVTVSPPTAIDRDRTLLMLTWFCIETCPSDADVDQMGVRGTINLADDMVFERDDGAGSDVGIAWEIIEFPATFLRVHHETTTMADSVFTITDALSFNVTDYDKTVVFTAGGTPFGYGTGETTDNSSGDINLFMFWIYLIDNESVFMQRDDSAGDLTIDYQVVEFLEPTFPEATQDQNVIKQIITQQNTFTAGNDSQDYTISPALVNVNKTIAFVTMRNSQSETIPEVSKSWEIIDENTFRVYGSNSPSVTNAGMNFTLTLIEFDTQSPIFVQQDHVQYAEARADVPIQMAISPVNTTNSFILQQGLNLNDAEGSDQDPSWGAEEFSRIRLVNGSQWEHDVDLPQDVIETLIRTQIIDWNQNDIFVQRSVDTLTGTLLEINPPTSVPSNRTALFATYKTSSGNLTAHPSNSSISGHINTTGTLIFEREVTGSDISISWEILTFPQDYAFVHKGIASQAGTVSNSTDIFDSSTVISNSTNTIPMGTIGVPQGYGNGRGSNTIASGFNSTTAQITLENTTAVRIIRDDSTGTFDLGYQIIEFLPLAFNVTVAQDFILNLTDTSTALDDQALGINKTETDVTSAVDLAINFDIFKSLGDVSTVNDNVIVNISSILITNQSDIVLATDNVFLNITKLVNDIATTNDTVTITNIIPLLINASENTVTALDSVFIFVNTTVPPTPPPTGGGGSTFQPDPPTLSPVRLIGLDVNSELLFVQPASQIPSDFLITWFGTTQEDVKIVNIEPSEGFASFNDWFVYTTPETLDITTTEGFENRFPTDPRSELNQALNAFQVIAPRNACLGQLENEITASCLNPILYEIPLEFEFDVKGAKFKQQHIVLIDARIPEACESFIDSVICFIQENWIALSAILLFFIIIVGITKRKTRKVKTVHIIRSRDIDQLGEGRTSRKFKKLRRK